MLALYDARRSTAVLEPDQAHSQLTDTDQPQPTTAVTSPVIRTRPPSSHATFFWGLGQSSNGDLHHHHHTSLGHHHERPWP